MNPTHPLAALAERRRNRTRVVIICRTARHGRLVLRTLGMRSHCVTPASAARCTTWRHWMYGYPPPLLVIDADLQPEDVTGAQLVVLVEPARRPGEPLRVRVIGREVNRLFTLLRAAAGADAWQ